MSLLGALRSGAVGAIFDFEGDLEVACDERATAEFVDRARAVSWWAFFFERLYLDLSPHHEAQLRRDVENHARFLFESGFAATDIPDRRPHDEPRTADPTWSPVVDLELVAIGGARALLVVHRMHYEPGLEVVMGHALVPLRAGLLELRAVAGTRQTGLRETTLSFKASLATGFGPGGELGAHAAVRFDDPVFDDVFPDHPLSRVRDALRWCRARARSVDEPGNYAPGAEVVLSDLGCAITPPPRFVVAGRAADGASFEFHRVSLAGTDGVDTLAVERTAERARLDEHALSRFALEAARRLHVEADVRDVTCVAYPVEALGGRRCACVLVEGRGHLGKLRRALGWFVDQDARVWCVHVGGTAAQPRDVLMGDLRAALSSWREARSPASRPRR